MTELSAADDAASHYIIVYQMGKVGSTSIVATLDAQPGVEAVQCHFLGEEALSSIIRSITSADMPEYFFNNEFGQFQVNTKITRRMNLLRSGKSSGTRLLVISLARNPFDWARSSTLQDIEGYIPILKDVANVGGHGFTSNSECVPQSLKDILEASSDVLSKVGGIDGFLTASAGTRINAFSGTIFETLPSCLGMFYMLLRPANWFESHFERALGLKVEDMQRTGNAWCATKENADYAIFRYEDFQDDLPKYLSESGICTISSFLNENVSSIKEHSQAVRDAFSSEAGQKLGMLYGRTEYSRTFGYTSLDL